MVWFKDQLEKFNPAIDRVEKVALIEDFADAMAIVEKLKWETAGNDVQNEIQKWFDQKYPTGVTRTSNSRREIVRQIVNDQEQFDGLDWLVFGLKR